MYYWKITASQDRTDRLKSSGFSSHIAQLAVRADTLSEAVEKAEEHGWYWLIQTDINQVHPENAYIHHVID